MPNELSRQSAGQLKRVLNDELKLYERYLQLLQADKEFMLRLKVEELEQSNKEKSNILLKLQIADTSRRQLITEIARQTDREPTALRLKDLVGMLAPADRQALEEVRTKLQSIISDVRNLSEINRQFASHSLRWMASSLNRIKSLMSPTIYNPKGKVVQSVLNGNIVERQI